MLVLDIKNQTSASNFTRKVLSLLYEEDQLAVMTAAGRKRNSLSISPADLSSIYGKLFASVIISDYILDLC